MRRFEFADSSSNKFWSGQTIFLALESEWFVGGPADPAAIHTITHCGLDGAQWRSLSPLLVSEIQRDLYQMNWTS